MADDIDVDLEEGEELLTYNPLMDAQPVGETKYTKQRVFSDDGENYYTRDIMGNKMPYIGPVVVSYTNPDGTDAKGEFHAGPTPKCVCEIVELMNGGCQCGTDEWPKK